MKKNSNSQLIKLINKFDKQLYDLLTSELKAMQISRNKRDNNSMNERLLAS